MRQPSRLVIALLVVGCCPCDPRGHARDLAGDDATDCGFVPLGADRTMAITCAEAASAAGEPFLVGFQRQGRDSEVRTYVASDGSTTWALGYDGDLSGGDGGCARLVASRCTGAVARFNERDETVILSCPSDGTANTVLCDR